MLGILKRVKRAEALSSIFNNLLSKTRCVDELLVVSGFFAHQFLVRSDFSAVVYLAVQTMYNEDLEVYNSCGDDSLAKKGETYFRQTSTLGMADPSLMCLESLIKDARILHTHDCSR